LICRPVFSSGQRRSAPKALGALVGVVIRIVVLFLLLSYTRIHFPMLGDFESGNEC